MSIAVIIGVGLAAAGIVVAVYLIIKHRERMARLFRFAAFSASPAGESLASRFRVDLTAGRAG